VEVAVSPDGKTLASGSAGGRGRGEIVLWDIASGKKLRSLTGHDDFFFTLAFAPDGKTLATGMGNTIQLWDVGTGERLRVSREDYGACSLAFAPDGKTLISTSQNAALQLWDVATLKLIRR
jgi:WD40 repeat protein